MATETTASRPSIARSFSTSDGVTSVPAAVSTFIRKDEFGDGILRKTRLNFQNLPITIPDATAYVGTQVLDFPVGRIVILSCVSALTLTTTTAIASTLNSGVSVQYGFGTATASATTLATTMININPGTGQSVPTFTSSTTINVASAEATSALVVSSTAQFDGTSTNVKVYFNLAVGTGTDIDADAIVTLNGYAIITWFNAGDY